MRKIEDPTIVVDADGVLITASGVGSSESVVIRSDNPKFVSSAKKAANSGQNVEIIYGADSVKAGWDSSIAILAALMSVCRGRTYIISAPEEVLVLLKEIGNVPTGAIV